MIDAVSTAAAASPAARPARSAPAGRSFLETLSARTAAVAPAPAATGSKSAAPAYDASATGEARRAELSAQFQQASLQYADAMRAIFTLVGDATGQPISESVGYRRSGNHFEFYSARQRNDGPDDGPQFDHPQGEILEAVFNGASTDPELGDLVDQVKTLLKQADALYAQAQQLEKQHAEACGMDPDEVGNRPLDGDFVFAMPTRFVEEGQAMAQKNPGAFAKFRATLTAEDWARLSDEQVYSRFFVSAASKEEMQAALEAERQRPAREKSS